MVNGSKLTGRAGAVRPEKNVSRLLRAFAPLRDDAVLIVVGDGPDGVDQVLGPVSLGDVAQGPGREAAEAELLAERGPLRVAHR